MPRRGPCDFVGFVVDQNADGTFYVAMMTRSRTFVFADEIKNERDAVWTASLLNGDMTGGTMEQRRFFRNGMMFAGASIGSAIALMLAYTAGDFWGVKINGVFLVLEIVFASNAWRRWQQTRTRSNKALLTKAR